MICPVCFGRKYDFKKDGNSGYFVECKKCHGTGEIDEYKLSLDFQKFFPDRVRNSREFYIRTCPTEKLVDIIYDLIRWNKPIHGVFMDNTDAENKKFIKMWLQGEYKE